MPCSLHSMPHSKTWLYAQCSALAIVAILQAEDILKVGADKSLVLDCVLGKGACGTVYKGTWKGLDVAVKTVLFTEHTEGSNLPQKARAILEAAVSASMSHPNIVPTYHYDIKPIRAHHEGIEIDAMAGLDDWKLFLVQEYCHCTLSYGISYNLFHR
ncbi:hypothetical protein DUNSADRAFT_8763 [Dunaliella salina]|uniref:Protein kinase domain-containing protein n=1 Tax=Dunaliella salina TaxID=3046 RepID=A0ABQ7FSU2_DUNSA|nr:hypothetical protein DUNSADRAFT_8763 [Dunaliella salina]|eukprot:KAF5825549.1 hypothetical protein DUNSADRAFT_8763 [Dunaliella salina]